MLIFGQRTVRKKLGHVAEYCPFCDDLKPAAATRLRRVAHFYFLPLGRGNEGGTVVLCVSCNSPLLPTTQTYPGRSLHSGDLDALVHETNPALPDWYASRLALEDLLLDAEATSHERLGYLHRVVNEVAPAIDARTRRTHVDRVAGIGCVGAILMASCVPTLILSIVLGAQGPSGQAHRPVADVVIWVCMSLAALLGVYTAYRLVTDARRFVRRRVMAALVPRLALVQPTDTELADAHTLARAVSVKASRYLRPRRLRAALHRADVLAQQAHDLASMRTDP